MVAEGGTGATEETVPKVIAGHQEVTEKMAGMVGTHHLEETAGTVGMSS